MNEINKKLVDSFLKSSRVEYDNFEKIAGDMSFRSYYRVFLAKNIVNDDKKLSENLDIFNLENLQNVVSESYQLGLKSLILMYAPPDLEKCDDFINIANYLTKNSFSAPRILSFDKKNGFLLLEDLGNISFNKILSDNNSSELEIDLYKKSIDCLIKIQQTEPPKNIENYCNELLFKEVKLFVDWYVKYEKNIEFNSKQNQQFKKLWFELFDKLSDDKYLVLRDYHADNLMILEHMDGYKKVGLLDFQDAVLGCRAYDLVSLLEDIRREVKPDLAQKMLQYYLENYSVNRELFLQDYEILSLQRNIKILGIISRVIRLYKKPKYDKLFAITRKLVFDRINNKSENLAKISDFLKEFI